MHKAHTTGQNIERQLNLLVLIDLTHLDRANLNQIHYAPVQPSIAHLNVETGLVIIDRLLIVNSVDVASQVKAQIIGVQSVHQANFVVLADSYQTIQDILCLQSLWVVYQVG